MMASGRKPDFGGATRGVFQAMVASPDGPALRQFLMHQAAMARSTRIPAVIESLRDVKVGVCSQEWE